MFASVAGEMAVVTVDHRRAGSHVVRETEKLRAGTEREGRERVSEIVDTEAIVCAHWGLSF